MPWHDPYWFIQPQMNPMIYQLLCGISECCHCISNNYCQSVPISVACSLVLLILHFVLCLVVVLIVWIVWSCLIFHLFVHLFLLSFSRILVSSNINFLGFCRSSSSMPFIIIINKNRMYVCVYTSYLIALARSSFLIY